MPALILHNFRFPPGWMRAHRRSHTRTRTHTHRSTSASLHVCSTVGCCVRVFVYAHNWNCHFMPPLLPLDVVKLSTFSGNLQFECVCVSVSVCYVMSVRFRLRCGCECTHTHLSHSFVYDSRVLFADGK